MTHTIQSSILIPRYIFDVFEFFSNANNLERITPSELCIRIVTPGPIEMEEGTIIDYHLRLYGIPFKWSSLISLWDPPNRFVDEQTRGPYRTWIHTHQFTEHAGGTRITDEVVYRLPFWPLGEIFFPFIHGQIRKIFDFRKKSIKKIMDMRQIFKE